MDPFAAARTGLLLNSRHRNPTARNFCDRCGHGYYAQNVSNLVNLVNRFVPNYMEIETFALNHHDLHEGNIMVNDKGRIMALLDWECVPVVPSWRAALLPKFLDKATRTKNPRKDKSDSEDQLFDHLEQFECLGRF